MRKIATAAAIAALVAASAATLALAQSPSHQAIERSGASNWESLTEARINIVKAALQLTPDQEKYWPPIEDAIRARAKDRQTRVAAVAEEVRKLRTGDFEAVRDRKPIEFLRQHSDALVQRAADLKKLADAWQPLYQTLIPIRSGGWLFLRFLCFVTWATASNNVVFNPRRRRTKRAKSSPLWRFRYLGTLAV